MTNYKLVFTLEFSDLHQPVPVGLRGFSVFGDDYSLADAVYSPTMLSLV